MDPFRATAFHLALWYAVLAALGVVLLIALNDVEPATAFLIAAHVALLFALLLIAGVIHLTRHVTRGPFWNTLPPAQRPASAAGRRMACRALHDTWLRFAKGAAAVAIVLCAFAYASNGVSASAFASAARPAVKQSQPSGPGYALYRSLLPTN
jgi:hypothetical protein